jgi:DNA-binding PadR family transcriptional regulator
MAVREGLLVVLSEGPNHGYQLKVAFEDATGGVWPLNVGQVYTTLERLARDGLVEAEAGEDGQKTYAITDEGVDELGAWWEATTTDDPPPRDELILKVLMAVSQGPDQALAVISRQRDALLTELQRRRRASEPLSRRAAPSLAQTLMNDALLVRAEADLRWLDLCEERIGPNR